MKKKKRFSKFRKPFVNFSAIKRVRNHLVIPYFVLTVWKKSKIYLKIFREINLQYDFLVKKLISRNFCEKLQFPLHTELNYTQNLVNLKIKDFNNLFCYISKDKKFPFDQFRKSKISILVLLVNFSIFVLSKLTNFIIFGNKVFKILVQPQQFRLN